MPEPLPPDVMVIHAALLVAVQAQPDATVTVIEPLPLLEPMLADAGEIVGVQGAPFWVTVKVAPPTLNVPVRGDVDEFGATA